VAVANNRITVWCTPGKGNLFIASLTLSLENEEIFTSPCPARYGASSFTIYLALAVELNPIYVSSVFIESAANWMRKCWSEAVLFNAAKFGLASIISLSPVFSVVVLAVSLKISCGLVALEACTKNPSPLDIIFEPWLVNAPPFW